MNDVQLAQGLGWFSLGLGATEVLAASQLSEFFNIGDKTTTFRTLGAREIANGVAILGSNKKSGPVWARVVGDVIDAAVLLASTQKPRSNRGRLAGALAFVAVAGIADYLVARRLSA
jgi:hypothetical protein